ncbi:hypothetical protein M378DRAFT_160315, partial [Amanita muscaria Koide BX008]
MTDKLEGACSLWLCVVLDPQPSGIPQITQSTDIAFPTQLKHGYCRGEEAPTLNNPQDKSRRWRRCWVMVMVSREEHTASSDSIYWVKYLRQDMTRHGVFSNRSGVDSYRTSHQAPEAPRPSSWNNTTVFTHSPLQLRPMRPSCAQASLITSQRAVHAFFRRIDRPPLLSSSL